MDQRLGSVIHWYDTSTRRIACGSPGQMGSTKHQREVTCERCRELLARRATGEDPHAVPAFAN